MDALYEYSLILEGDAGIFKGCSVHTLASNRSTSTEVRKLTGFSYLSSITKNFVWQGVVHKHGACGNTLPMRVDHYHRQAVQHDELRQDLRVFLQHTLKRNATERIITRQQLTFFFTRP
jgi:hypothetical protein